MRETTPSFRVPPTLADLDGDGVRDIVAISNGEGVATVHAYRYTGGAPTRLPGWPQPLDDPSLGSSASPLVPRAAGAAR